MRILVRWGIFRITVNSIAPKPIHPNPTTEVTVNPIGATSTFSSTLPQTNRSFLARHKTPIHRSFPMPNPQDPNYKEKLNSTCSKMLEHLKEDYKIAFSSEITPKDFVDVPPIRIEVKPNSEPFRSRTARSYPAGREAECREIIRKLTASGIIRRNEKVTRWCSYGFFVPKHNRGLRLVVDFRKINSSCNRIGIPFDSNKDIFNQIPSSACAFITLDLTSSFFQLRVAEEDQDYLSFLVQCGKLNLQRAAMGELNSGDNLNINTNPLLLGLEGSLKIIDDFCLHSITVDQPWTWASRLLFNTLRMNWKFNPEKAQCTSSVEFCGYTMQAAPDNTVSVLPSPNSITDLTKFAPPKTRKQLQSLLGVMNVIMKWNPGLSSLSAGMRALNKGNTHFAWRPEHQKELEHIQHLANQLLPVHPFKRGRETTLYTDASSEGLSMILMQKKQNEDKQLFILAASTGLKESHKRYSTFELEMMGVVWALKKVRVYLFGGHPILVLTDHASLAEIESRPLDPYAPCRMQRALEDILSYNVRIQHVSKANNALADYLSRRNQTTYEAPEVPRHLPREEAMVAVTYQGQIIDKKLIQLIDKANEDEGYQDLVEAVATKSNIHLLDPEHPAQEYKKVWKQLSVSNFPNGRLVLLDTTRVVPPKSTITDLMEELHKHHASAGSMVDTVKMSYYWPRYEVQIQDYVRSCLACEEIRRLHYDAPPPCKPMWTTTSSLETDSSWTSSSWME